MGLALELLGDKDCSWAAFKKSANFEKRLGELSVTDVPSKRVKSIREALAEPELDIGRIKCCSMVISEIGLFLTNFCGLYTIHFELGPDSPVKPQAKKPAVKSLDISGTDFRSNTVSSGAKKTPSKGSSAHFRKTPKNGFRANVPRSTPRKSVTKVTTYVRAQMKDLSMMAVPRPVVVKILFAAQCLTYPSQSFSKLVTQDNVQAMTSAVKSVFNPKNVFSKTGLLTRVENFDPETASPLAIK